MAYEDFCALSMALHAAPMLKTLSFTWCSLQPGIGPLSEAFANNSTHTGIEELNLIGCHLSDIDLGKLLYRLKGTIQKLDVEDNYMHTLGSAAIAQLLRQNQVVHLDLRFQQRQRIQNRDDSDNAEPTKIHLFEIAQALRFNQSCKSLDLSHNRLDDEDLFGLIEALVDNTTLESLNLSSNQFTRAGMEAFAQNLNHMRGLRNLRLVHNSFDSAAALLEALKSNRELQTMCIDRHLPEYMEIQYYLTLNRGGRRLILQSNVPLGLWPLVLERCSGWKLSHDVMFHFLEGPVMSERRA
jgi:hypothetical protein